MRPGERLNIYLTNTLEPIEPQGNLLLPALSREVKAAQAVKDKPILVITGNPPYSGHSKNTGAWITELIDTYKTVDGKPAGREELQVAARRLREVYPLRPMENGTGGGRRCRHHHQSFLSGQSDLSGYASVLDADL